MEAPYVHDDEPRAHTLNMVWTMSWFSYRMRRHIPLEYQLAQRLYSMLAL